jgi:hypothetical protein
MLAVLRVQSATFETTSTARRRRDYFRVVEMTYTSLRDSVSALGREARLTIPGPDVDSLDREFERLFGEE